MAEQELVRVNRDDLSAVIPATGRDVVLARVQSLIEAVPEAGEGDDLAILMQIMGAEKVEDLDKPWVSNGIDGKFGQSLRVVNLKRRPSDYADGLGVFLIVDIVNEDTGETETITTGSVSIVGQMLMAYRLVGLPFTCTPVRATKPTSNGYYPHHLEHVRAG